MLAASLGTFVSFSSRLELPGLLAATMRFCTDEPEGDRGLCCGMGAGPEVICSGNAVGPTEGTRTGPGVDVRTCPSWYRPMGVIGLAPGMAAPATPPLLFCSPPEELTP